MSVSSAAFSNLGYVEGSQAEYTSSEGLTVGVLIVVTTNDPPLSQAQEFASDGWQVALAFRKFAIAASTGTHERTSATPETPVLMETTPIPGTENEVRALLARSPALSPGYIENHDVSSA